MYTNKTEARRMEVKQRDQDKLKDNVAEWIE